ncbi:MAG TPA: DNA primase catalytic subunit PriS [Thermoplasmata archaeon]|nr:DNA primase catalytic subunit PriS [Thermoplasmata archaeon]
MNFLKKKFSSYYFHPKIEFPERFDRREYAFIFFNEDKMYRHISFPSIHSLETYLKMNAPAHAYYSSAYYRNPSAGTMKEKEWMGADLIFDLDADHLPNVENLSYEETLEKVKLELKKLVSFLTEDFGFSKKDLKIYFSGGRGYHCHVINKKVLSLDSQERREIVDYVTATGINLNGIMKERSIYKERFKDKTFEIYPMEGGWRGRIAREIIRFFHEIKSMERGEALSKLMEIEGIGRRTAEEIYNALTEDRLKRIEYGKIDQTTGFKRIAKPLIKKIAVSLHSETDEPVTTDIKRLIRLPGSLHGKTGLRVTKLEMDDIENFSPLRDAVAFGEDEVKIKLVKPINIKMMENEFNLKKGEIKVPEYLAVFLIAKKVATL